MAYELWMMNAWLECWGPMQIESSPSIIHGSDTIAEVKNASGSHGPCYDAGTFCWVEWTNRVGLPKHRRRCKGESWKTIASPGSMGWDKGDYVYGKDTSNFNEEAMGHKC